MVQPSILDDLMARTISVKSAEQVAQKWKDVTPTRAGYYEAAAPEAGDEWEKNTIAAGATYKASLAVAGIEKRFVGGVKRAGAEKFARKVRDVGVSRYSPGVEAAMEDMKKGISPYIDLLNGMSIPDRGPRGSPGNYAIVQKVGEALHKKRLAILAATA